MSKRSIEHDGTELTFPTATFRIWTPSPKIFVGQLDGVLPVEIIEPFITGLNRVIKPDARAHVFLDASGTTSYAPQVRIDLVRYFAAHKPDVATLSIYVRSKLVAMGVSVANLALGGFIESFSDERKFAQTLDRTLAEHGAKFRSNTLFATTRPSRTGE